MELCFTDSGEIEDLQLKPCCAMYAPKSIRDLQEGSEYLWCSCGLSKDKELIINSRPGVIHLARRLTSSL